MPNHPLHPVLKAFRRGDERAAVELWSRLAPRLLAVASSVLGRSEADGGGAEDAVQRAFLSMLQLDARAFRSIRDPQAWFVVTTRNEAKMMVRAATRRRGREDSYAADPGAHAAADPADRVLSIVGDDAVTHVRDAVLNLPDELREVIALRHVGGLTFEQIGHAVQLSKSGAVQRYRQATAAVERDLAAIRSKQQGRRAQPNGRTTNAS